jgi:hypothetical protein
MRSLIAFVLTVAVGCGAATELPAEGPTDAGAEAANVPPMRDASLALPADANAPGAISCGPMTCAPGLICVTTLQGAGPCEAVPDGGDCGHGMTAYRGCCEGAVYACKSSPTACVLDSQCACPELCDLGGNGCECAPLVSSQYICDCVGT